MLDVASRADNPIELFLCSSLDAKPCHSQSDKGRKSRHHSDDVSRGGKFGRHGTHTDNEVPRI